MARSSHILKDMLIPISIDWTWAEAVLETKVIWLVLTQNLFLPQQELQCFGPCPWGQQVLLPKTWAWRGENTV